MVIKVLNSHTLTPSHTLIMGYVKYTKEQLEERKMAQAAIMAARALLKSQREAKKAKKEGVIQLRRELKAEIRNRKEAKIAAKKRERELKDLKTKCRPLLAVLRKVYKPYLVARRKVARLQKQKAKAAIAADRKAAKEAAAEAKKQIELRKAEEFIAGHIQKTHQEHGNLTLDILEREGFVLGKTPEGHNTVGNGEATVTIAPKKTVKMKKRPAKIQTKGIKVSILPTPIAA